MKFDYSKSLYIIFLTGASGAGKTTLVNRLISDIDNQSIVFLHFDSIGVPSVEEMTNKFGSPSEWQKAMTYIWVRKLITEYNDRKLVILEGQVNLDFISAAFKEYNFDQYSIVLVHCDAATRHQRLHQGRNQPELVNDNMDNWSNHLLNQALEKNVPILDTTLMTIDEMVRWFKEYTSSLKR